jgi:hypothetical protein
LFGFFRAAVRAHDDNRDTSTHFAADLPANSVQTNR